MSVLIFLFVVLKNMQTLVLAGGEKKKKKSNSNLGNTGLENLSIQYFVFSI